MTVDAEKLVKMAEQISANMNYTDDEAVVAARIADHLGRFWDPRMQATILSHAREHSNEYSAVLLAALELLASHV